MPRWTADDEPTPDCRPRPKGHDRKDERIERRDIAGDACESKSLTVRVGRKRVEFMQLVGRVLRRMLFYDLRKCPVDNLIMLPKRVDDYSTVSREMHRVAEDIFYAHLKRVGLKRTAQRDAILRIFLETRDHLSTEELHHLVQSRDPRIGFTTVYRTLKLFADCGLASAVAFQDGVARYEHQLNRRNHHHMVCTECGSSVEFFSPEVEKVEQEIGLKHRYITTRHTFQIYGICEECGKKNRRYV